MTHSGHASGRTRAIPWRRNRLHSGIEMTLPCASPVGFGASSPLPISGSETRMRQSVAVCATGRGANGTPALSAVVAHLLGSLSDVVTSGRAGKALAPFHPILCSSPAKRRSFGMLRSRAITDRRRGPSQLHRSVHSLLKVSSCAVLTQSCNSGNNLQLSEKFFRRSEICDFENSGDAEQRR